MMPRRMIFAMLLVMPVPAFADFGKNQYVGNSSALEQTDLGGMFLVSDPGARSGCIMEAAAYDKDVVHCDAIEIPGMVYECIDGVAEVTAITQDRFRITNEKYRDHCLRAAGYGVSVEIRDSCPRIAGPRAAKRGGFRRIRLKRLASVLAP